VGEKKAMVEIMKKHEFPEWASYLAMDGNGDWFFYENEPRPNRQKEVWEVDGGTVVYADKGWGKSLIRRENAE
jgi:hypothetical protein